MTNEVADTYCHKRVIYKYDNYCLSFDLMKIC